LETLAQPGSPTAQANAATAQVYYLLYDLSWICFVFVGIIGLVITSTLGVRRLGDEPKLMYQFLRRLNREPLAFCLFLHWYLQAPRFSSPISIDLNTV
jgi:hypothetical protein